LKDDDWYKWLARKELLYPFQTLVIGRDLVSSLDRYLETGQKDFQGSSAFSVFESAIGALALVTKPLSDQEITRANLKDAVMTVGYFGQLPSRQVWQTGEYFYDWITGNEEPSNPVEGVWRGIVTGKKKD